MKDLTFLKLEYKRNSEIKDFLDNESNIDLGKLIEKFHLSKNQLKYIIKNLDSIQNKLLERIDLIETICIEFKKGRTLKCISEEYNTTRQNINRIVSLGNLNRYDGGINKKKINRIEEIKNLVNSGQSLEYLMGYLNLSEYTIRNYCFENDIEIYTENQIKFNNLKVEILSLRSEGKSQIEISDCLNISQSYVSKVLLSENQRTYLSDEDFLKRDNTIYLDYCTGIDISSLSKKYNMSISNIRRILKKIS